MTEFEMQMKAKMRAMEAREWTDYRNVLVAIIKGEDKRRTTQAMWQFEVGQRVKFLNRKRGIVMEGTILEFLNKNVRVNCGAYGPWRVNATLLQPVS